MRQLSFKAARKQYSIITNIAIRNEGIVMTLKEIYTAIASTGIYTVPELIRATNVSIDDDNKLHFEMPWYPKETIEEIIFNGGYELPKYLLIWSMRGFSSMVEGIDTKEDYDKRVATVSESREVDKIVSVEYGEVKVLRFFRETKGYRYKARQSQPNSIAILPY